MLKNHYYRKLSKEEKYVYDALLEGYLKRKKIFGISSFPTKAIIEALNIEHPELFYVNITQIVSIDGIDGNVYIKPRYLYSIKEEQSVLNKVKSIVKRLKLDDYEMTVRNIHNYFVRYIEYDNAELEPNIAKRENHSIYGVFKNSMAVCEGVSKAFSYMLSLCGIDCTCVQGTKNGNGHMWNVVNLQGRNYHIDVTNDIGATEKNCKKPRYFYYLVTDDVMKRNFDFNEQFYCYSTEMNLFYHYKRVFFNKSELKSYLTSISPNADTVYFQYMGKDMSYAEMKTFVDLYLPFSYQSTQVNPQGTIYYFDR